MINPAASYSIKITAVLTGFQRRWLVPLIEDGRQRKVSVEAWDQWQAQAEAAKTVNMKLTKRRPYPLHVLVEHAIPLG